MLLGKYLIDIYGTQATYAQKIFGGVERLCYRLGNIQPEVEMTWTTYAKALLLFNIIGFVFLMLILRLQGILPLNPQALPAVPWLQTFNVAISFTTNTNWQSYAGESTMSYLTQMLGLSVQNFLSAATGMAALLALIRGLTRNSADTVGNFWRDLIRTIVYLLLPLSIILSVIMIGEGVIQTFSPYINVAAMDGGTQTIPLGPAASQVAIKQIGSNGGGFFNANSAHPFENPTGMTNFLQSIAILLIPTASVFAYGSMVGHIKHGWILFFVMFLLWTGGLAVSIFTQHMYNPAIGVEYPYLEGIETRFGIEETALRSVSTTATSNGSVNGMLSSLSPLAGCIALLNIMLGELIFGGIGVGLCSMIMFTILTVFLSGLMVGRTPEYLGKKIGKKEMQWVILAVLTPSAIILIGSGISSVLPVGVANLGNPGPHGLSEILYAFASAAGNNGSAFAGLNANTEYYNIVLAFAMLIGRIAIILSSLALAGMLAKKKVTPESRGTFSTSSFLFALLLSGVILTIEGLTFFPALSLGPIVEHLLMLDGRVF